MTHYKKYLVPNWAVSHEITMGRATLCAVPKVRPDDQPVWVAPGGQIIRSEARASFLVVQMNQLMRGK